MFTRLCFALAQLQFWQEPDTEPAAPVKHSMSFSDLRQGLRQWNDGFSDNNSFRNGLLVVLAIVGIIALVLHFRQRRHEKKTLDSEKRLAWELSRLVPFPFGTRLLLCWVARSTGVHFATLLISAQSFERAVNAWAAATFSLLRRWGKSRLQHLQRVLFVASSV